MHFDIAKIDGSDVVRWEATGIRYTAREWRQLVTDDSSSNLAGYHGRRVSATFARKRVIVLQGVVTRIGNAHEKEDVEWLRNLFALQSNTGEVDPRTLYVKDEYGDEWTMPVKVREPLEFIDYDDNFRGAVWKWSVILESVASPVYYGNSEKTSSGNEGAFGGFELETELGTAFDSYVDPIECANVGNHASPVRFVITCLSALDSPLTVANVTDGTFFALDVSWVAWDVFDIDSEAQTATKNGESVKHLRMPGSAFPTATWTTEFVVFDGTNGIWFSEFSVSAYFRDALM